MVENAGRYADMTAVDRKVLALAIVLLASLTGACAARGGGVPVPRPFPGASLPPGAVETAPESPPPTTTVPALISTALGFRGTPYRNGGTDPSGFDCSGFVQWVFAQQGMALPREVREQYRTGEEID